MKSDKSWMVFFGTLLLLLAVLISFAPAAVAGKTEVFKEKEGFNRPTKDIVNTLKNNEVTTFQTLLDGLQQAFSLDETLKGKGPFTLFAPSDAAFNHYPQDDLQSLFANKPKLKEVLQYCIVPGEIDFKKFGETKTVKTLEGHELTLSSKDGSLYADKAMIKMADIPCTNGRLYVLDRVIMPPVAH